MIAPFGLPLWSEPTCLESCKTQAIFMSLHLLLPMQTGPFYLGWDISPEWPFGLDVASFPSSLNLRNKEFMVMFSSVQFSSVAQSCPTLWNPMNGSTPGLSVHHQLPEFTEAHVHRVSDAIQPSHLLSSPSPPVFNISQHQGSFLVTPRAGSSTSGPCLTFGS